ncbi:MAG: hypothetical protein ACJ04P_02890 [Halioglobus sp.]
MKPRSTVYKSDISYFSGKLKAYWRERLRQQYQRLTGAHHEKLEQLFKPYCPATLRVKRHPVR